MEEENCLTKTGTSDSQPDNIKGLQIDQPLSEEPKYLEDLESTQKIFLEKTDVSSVSNLKFCPNHFNSFIEYTTKIHPRVYQTNFARKVINSLVHNEGKKISALWSRGSGKCLGRGTQVLMFNGSVKNVENIRVGDTLMGDDSTPRNVLSICQGEDEMFEVKSTHYYSESFLVNKAHILSIHFRGRRGKKGRKKDISVDEYLSYSELSQKDRIKGYKVAIKYPREYLRIDPYWFGLWLGDGNREGVAITNKDEEIISYLREYALSLGMTLKEYKTKNRCSSYAITNGNYHGRRKKNILWDFIKNLKWAKTIPHGYLCGSRGQRLKLLAGLIDSDGHKPKRGGFTGEIISKNYNLAKQIQILIRSLGFRCSLREKLATCGNYSCIVYRLTFFGELWEIPTKIKRKKWEKGKLRENPCLFGFKLVPKGKGQYFGFEIDGNKRFVLGDFTVTHNTEAVVDTIFFATVALPSIYQINRLRKDFTIGLFAPIRKQAIGNIYYRLRDHIIGFEKSVLGNYLGFKADTNNVENMRISNGVRILSLGASKEAHIEGAHCHLLVTDETQDIPDIRIRKSIMGMGIAKNATRVMIGSATPEHKRYFYQEISKAQGRQRQGMIITAPEAMKYMNPSDRRDYSVYLEKMKKELGEDSIEYRTQYMCEWITSQNTLISLEKLRGFATGKTILEEPVETCYAGIDVGKSDASTIVTIIDHLGNILNWLEMQGDDYVSQGENIKNFLMHYNISKTFVDTTGGGGDALVDILQSKNTQNIERIWIKSQVKDKIYHLMKKKLRDPLFSYPKQECTERFKFERQMTEMVIRYKSGLLTPSHRTERDAHDDYVDSFALALFARSQDEGEYMEVGRI